LVDLELLIVQREQLRSLVLILSTGQEKKGKIEEEKISHDERSLLGQGSLQF